jgi:NAD(P)-dependent dehydrogenase (short-subunit alcohol dehydrogenase family)
VSVAAVKVLPMPAPVDLAGHVALVAGGSRGATRAIAVELGRAGVVVHVTGRSARGRPSPMQRPESIEDAVEQIRSAGGQAYAHHVDHSDERAVAALLDRITAAHHGRLDIVVNGIWGGDPMTDWEHPFWEQSVSIGLAMLRQAVETHIVTSAAAAPRLVARRSGLIIELTDGKRGDPYRGSLYYDLAKEQVARLALGMAEDLRTHQVAAVALAPGYLRSEAVLDRFGVSEVNWRDAITADPHFAVSESPVLVARCAVALAADPEILDRSGQSLASWDLAAEYELNDFDGSRPNWGAYYRQLAAGENPNPDNYR